MKTLGIVGGVGPEATVDYYRRIIARYQELRPDGSYPRILINSIDVHRMLNFMFAGQLDPMADVLLEEIEKLARGGADFALVAANTPHIVFDRVQPRASLPLLSIVEATRDAARAAGYRRVGLFGTRFTMEADFYSRVFTPADIAIVIPQEDERARIHDVYLNELLKNQFRPQSRDALLAIAAAMQARAGVEAIILAGTELPLLLRDAAPPVPWLDTTVIHVEAAVQRLLQD